jgi:N-acetylmuramoyl-L-alanine amidase
MIIVLDAGHTPGVDPGACGNGLREADLTGDICERIKAHLAAYDVQVELCPRTDSLTARAGFANALKADYFLSIHINAAQNADATGFESWCCEGTAPDSDTIREAIHKSVIDYTAPLGIVDRGKKYRSYTVLYATDMPAALLECLFISNETDALRLASEPFRDALANAIAWGLVEGLGLVKKTVAPDPTIEAINKLVAAGVIVSPDYWLINARPGEQCSGEYVARLLQSLAAHI